MGPYSTLSFSTQFKLLENHINRLIWCHTSYMFLASGTVPPLPLDDTVFPSSCGHWPSDEWRRTWEICKSQPGWVFRKQVHLTADCIGPVSCKRWCLWPALSFGLSHLFQNLVTAPILRRDWFKKYSLVV